MKFIYFKNFLLFVFTLAINIGEPLYARAEYDANEDLSYYTPEAMAAVEQELGLDTSFRVTEVEPDDIRLLFVTYPLDEDGGALWESTKVSVGRNALYLLPQKINAIEYGGVAISLFYNQTDRMPLAVNTLFGDLFDPPKNGRSRGFIPLLQVIVEGAVQDSEIDPEKLSKDIVTLLPLLQRLTVQQRQVGLFFQGGVAFGSFMFQIHTPFLVAERNFWLGSADREFVADIMNVYADGAEFDYNQVFRIRAGLGDTRLKLGLNMVNMTNFSLDFGVEAILPTSLISYDPRFQTHSEQVVEPRTVAREQFITNMTRVLDGVRDYELDPRLGNNGHFGGGIYLETKFGMFHDFVQLWSRFSYDLLARAKEDRMFMFKSELTTQELGRELTSDNPEAESAALVNQYLREKIIPSTFRCTVRPGGVFNFVTAATVNLARWRFTFGYDFYARQKEHIHKLHDTDVKLSSLLIERGVVERIQQHKLFTESLYSWTGPRADFAFGYGTDFTILSENIGNDWSIYLKFTASF